MKHLKPLVMMQLKDKIDFSFLKSKGRTISKIVFTLLGFVAIVAVCYLLFYVSSLFKLFSSLPMVPVSVIVVIFTLMFFLSTITCMFGLMKSLYLANDNQVLLTLPVKPNMVFVSKLIVYYIYELLKNCFFMLPLFLAYGIFSKFSLAFFPWLIVGFVLISALPVLIGALLSIPAMFVASFLKQVPALRFALFAILIGALLYGVISLIAIIPENINLMASWQKIYWRVQEFLVSFGKIFLPLTWLVNLVCGTFIQTSLSWQLFSIDTLWIFLGLIGSIAVLFTIAFFASRPLFFKMASSPFEYKKKLIKKNYYNKKRKMFHSSVLKEVKTSLRRSEFIYNMVAVIVVLPIAIFLLNKIFNAMNTKLLGTYMTFSFNVLLILLILLASNAMMASAHSSEGRSAYLMKAVPHKHSRYLFPKLIVSMVLTSVSALATAIIFGVFGKIGVLSTIMLYIMIMSFYVGHLFWSAELDIMNPQNEQYATTGSVANNPNERKSTILAFVISILAFLISLFLFNENISVAWVKLAIIGVVFAVARIYLYFTRIKVYYAEK